MKRFLQHALLVCGLFIVINSGYAQSITPAGALSALSTTYGTASSEITFTFTASGLGSNEVVTITAPAGFEVSTLGSGAGFGTTTTKQANGGGNIGSTTIYVRLSPTANAGSYLGNITLVGASASANEATVTSTINKLALTITGATASNKTYDGTTAATVTASPTLNGVLAGDAGNVSIAGGASGTFATATVGTAKAVTSNYGLTGSASANYSVTQPALSADITAKALTITGATANNKIYDGGMTATLGGSPALSGVIAADVANVTLNSGAATGTFASANVGTSITVTTSGYAISGTASGNYSLTQPTLSANITTKALTITGVTASNKPYDGTAAATLTGSPALSGVLAGDVANVTLDATGASGIFSDPNVGTSKTVTTSGYVITGTASGNYSLTQPTTTADITAIALTITGASASNKIYNGTTAATVTASPTLNGVLAGDVGNVSIAGGASGTFASKNVATSIVVTSNYSLTGSASGNYTVTQPALTADITVKSLTINGVTANNKGFDGTTTATLSGAAALLAAEAPGAGSTADGKPYTGDVVSVSGAATANFSSTGPGVGITVTVSGYTLSGAQAGNYTPTQPTGLTATIYAAEPTAPSTVMTFSSITNNTLTVGWTVPGAGGGANRILVVKQGGSPTAPADGSTYTANPAFGSGSTTAAGSYVVYVGSGSSVALTGFTTNTSYTFNLYELNGSAGTENYLTSSLLTGTQVTANYPTTQATSVTVNLGSTTTLSINWTDGNGAKRIAVIKDATGVFTPTNGTTYTAGLNYSTGTDLDGGAGKVVCIYNGTTTGRPLTVTNLSPNTQYTVEVYEYNGLAAAEQYLTPPASGSRFTLATLPSNSATSLVFSSVLSTQYTVSWTASTGAVPSDGYIVLRKIGSSPTGTPTNGTTYSVGNTIGDGTVAYVGAAVTFGETGLTPSTDYFYDVISYSGSGQSTDYKGGPLSNDQVTACLDTPPSSVTFSATGASTTTVNWTRGSGNNVLVIGRSGTASAVTPNPATTYTANTTFGSGTNLAVAGNDYFVVYQGTGTSVVVTGMNGNTAYNFKVYEYNSTNTCYLLNPATNDVTTAAANTNSTFTAGTGSATIASTATSQGTEVAAFTFTATDLGGDNISTRFTQLIFRPGTGSYPSVLGTDWTQTIAGAELYDNATFGGDNGGLAGGHGTAIITANTITIPSISDVNLPDLGSISNNTSRIYTLKIWLKAPLGTLASTMDNKNLAFSILGSDVTPEAVPGYSSFAPATTTESGSSNDKITVTATKININQQPTTSASAYVVLPQQPIFEATDVSGNRDLDISNALTVNTTNPTDLGPASPLANFTNGLADFTGSGFNFHNTGSSTMSVSITSPTLTSANSSLITVVASTNLGSSITTMSSSPLNNNTTGSISGGVATNAVLGFNLQTTGSPLTLTDLVFNSTVTPTGLISLFRLYSNSSDSFTGATQVATSTSLTFSGLNIALNGTATYFFLVCDVQPYYPYANPTITFSLQTGNVTVNAGSITGSTQTGSSYLLKDLTAPVIQSITINTNLINAWGFYDLTPSYHGNQGDFLLTFSEPVNGVTPSAIANTYVLNSFNSNFPDVSQNISSIAPVDINRNSVSAPSQYWMLTYNILGGSGYLEPAYGNTGSLIKDVAGNVETTPPGPNFVWLYYVVELPQPTNPVSTPSFIVTGSTTTSVNLQWTHAAGTQRATDYVIRAKESSMSFPGGVAIVDGTLLANDTDASDGIVVQNVTSNAYPSGPATQTLAFTGLKSGVSYDFEIYAITSSLTVRNYFSNSNWDYNPTPATLTTVIPVATSAYVNPFAATSTISSLTTTQVLAHAQTTPNLKFQVYDEPFSDVDNAPTKFTDLVIYQDAGGNSALLNDWTQVIAGAEITDGTNTYTVLNPSSGITSNQIIFTGLPSSSPGDFGYVADGFTPKNYSLNIWLKSALPGSLPNTIDNLHLSFRVDNTSFTLDNTSSNQKSTIFQSSSYITGAGANKITVDATKLLFTTANLPDKVGVNHTFATPPVVEAHDANDNLDLDFTGATISASNGINFSSAPSWSLGKLTFTTFTFSDPGLTQLTISKGGVTSAVSNSPTGPGGQTDVKISAYTSVNQVTGAGVPSLTVSSLITLAPSVAPSGGEQNASTLANLSFIVKDDDTVPAAEDDKLPTRISTITIHQNANNGTATGGANFDDWTNSIQGADLIDAVGGSLGITPTISSNSIVFSGIANSTAADLGYIGDGGSRTYTLKIWLKNPVSAALRDIFDGEDFVFEITNAADFGLTSVAGNYSSTLTTVSTFNSGNGNNAVDVTATQLDFIIQGAALQTPALNQSYDADIDFDPTTGGTQAGVIKARDLNQNLDRGYTAGVTITGKDLNLLDTRTYPINNGSGQSFATGQVTLNSNLQVSSTGLGFSGDQTYLIASSTVGPTTITGNSGTFTLNYSGTSDIIKDASFISGGSVRNKYHKNILYANYQASSFSSSLTPSLVGAPLERFLVRDGAGSSDADGTATTLQTLTLNLANWQDLRTVAIYADSVFIAEQSVSTLNPNFNSGTGDLLFTGLNAFSALDNTNKALTVYATFNASVTDNDIVQVKVTSVTSAGVSSSFGAGGTSTTFATLGSNDNQIEVVTDRLKFTIQPNPTSISSFTDLPAPQPVVQAQDVNGNLDVDYTGTIASNTITNTGTTSNNSSSGPPSTTTELKMFAIPAGNFVAGVFTFNSNFQFNEDSGTEPGGANFNGTGTINTALLSSIVTGTGTSFTTELSVGSIIKNSGGTTIGTVAFINSNTQLTLTATASLLVSGATYKYDDPAQTVRLKVPVTTNNQLGNLPTLATSSPFKVVGSYDSWIFFDPVFATTLNSKIYQQIDFVKSVDAGSGTTPTSNTSQVLAKVVLSDGGYANGLTFPRSSLLAKGSHNDSDGAATAISDFTVSFTNFQDISKIGLYTWNGTKIGSDYPAAASIKFTGLSAYSAPDDDTVTYVIRAVFKQTITADQDQINMQITQVTHASGSNFPEYDPIILNRPNPITLGGVVGGDVPPAGYNYLNVIATELDFVDGNNSNAVHQPSQYAGLSPSPVGQDPLLPQTTAGIVTARDYFGNVDKNFVTDAIGGITLVEDFGATSSTITNPTSAGWGFVQGVLDLTGMKYNATGTGTVRVLTKTSSAVNVNLDSEVPINGPGIGSPTYPNSVKNSTSPVTVINTIVQYDATTTTLDAGPDANGEANLKGGKTGLKIFGVTFTSSGATSAQPVLTQFDIGFKTGKSTPAGTSGKNWYYSTTGVTVFPISGLKVLYDGVDVSTKGGVLHPFASTNPGEYDRIRVDLTNFTNAHSLTSGAAPNPFKANIVLVVDVSSTTNGATQTLVPYLVDGGYLNPSTDSLTTVSNGTSLSIASNVGTTFLAPLPGEIDGIEFNFASANPPKLEADINIYGNPPTATNPYTPQSNVDPKYLAGTQLSLNTLKPQLVLQFDTKVGVLDNPTTTPTGAIYERATNTKVAELYFDLSGSVQPQAVATVNTTSQTISNGAIYDKLVFNVCNIGQPGTPLSTQLKNDAVYYVNIAAGSYGNGVGAGISDLQLNFYGGLNDNYELYFKTWSSKPPLVSNVSTGFNSTSSGTIVATFDQLGSAYYVVVPSGTTAPTDSTKIAMGGISTLTTPSQMNTAGMTAAIYTNVAPASTSGSGTGALFTVVVGSGTSITSVTQTTAGSGYKVNETITFNGSQFGGGSGTVTYPIYSITLLVGSVNTISPNKFNINAVGVPQTIQFPVTSFSTATNYDVYIYTDNNSNPTHGLNKSPVTMSFTGKSATGNLTTASPLILTVNAPVTLSSDGVSLLPAPLVASTTYYIQSIAGSVVKLSATPGGAAISLTSDGGGNITAQVPYYYFPNLIKGSTIFNPASPSASISEPLAPNNSLLYQICPDSYTILTQPLVISENSSTGTQGFLSQDGNGNPLSTQPQIANILLPPGFEFDRSVYPTIQLGPTAANDFVVLGAIPNNVLYKTSYASSSILQIQFKNTGTSYYDQISISGLKVIGKRNSVTQALPAQGDIQWFYGSDALTAHNKVPLKLATIGIAVPQSVPDFTNQYWQYSNNVLTPYHSNFVSIDNNKNAQVYMQKKVNAIPDNYSSSQVRLIPITPFSIPEDYLASTFTGTGVTGDQLTLAAVSKNAAFNITMEHTDVNGCFYSQSEQYIVYDHNAPISDNLGVTTNLNPGSTPANQSFTKGTVQDIANGNFNTSNVSNLTAKAGDANSISSTPILKSDKAGYTLLELQADLPVDEVVANNSLPVSANQLMSGAKWRSLVQSLPVNSFTPNPLVAGSTLVNATWDYANILNANASGSASATDVVNHTLYTAKSILSNGSFGNVYDYFKQNSPNSGDYFWTGGSLGKVEFTGLYQNTADNSIFVPFRQQVEMFVPAVPLIEVQAGTVFYDNTGTDPYVQSGNSHRPPTINNSQYPSAYTLAGKTYPSPDYKGVATFCEAGGQITLIAYPQAQGGSSVGKFAIYDLSAGYNYSTNTGTLINGGTAFVDNQNGTMTLDPSNPLVKNGNNDILVTYTFQQNNSPAIGVGYLVIRITPNPVAGFNMSSTVAGAGVAGASSFDALCAGSPITFDAGAASSIATPGNTSTPANFIKNFTWNFGDANSKAANAPINGAPTSGAIGGGFNQQIPLVYGYVQPLPPSFIANGGFGYKDSPAGLPYSVNLTYLTSGAGSGATANITVVNHKVVSVELTNPGSGYVAGDMLTSTDSTQLPFADIKNVPKAQRQAYSIDYGKFIMTFDKPWHYYSAATADAQVKLDLISNWNCPSLSNPINLSSNKPTTVVASGYMHYPGSVADIMIGDTGSPDFTFTGNCASVPVTFTYSLGSTNPTQGYVAAYDWNFNLTNVNSQPGSITGYNPSNTLNSYPVNVLFNNYPNTSNGNVETFTYNNSGIYTAQLTTTTNLGCKVSTSKLLGQLKSYQPVVIDFNADDGGFLSLDISTQGSSQTFLVDGQIDGSYVGRSSWQYNPTAKNWSTTKAGGTYYRSENSALYAACLDLAIPRPMISFNADIDVNGGGDGLVLQYSSDNKNILDKTKTWYTLGADPSTGAIIPGIEWYNANAIATSPGSYTLNSVPYAFNQKSLGWTGAGNVFQPKHALDNSVSNLQQLSQPLQLRYVFASANNAPLSGVTIDNIRFGSRTRTIMFENFTTTNAGTNSTLNSDIPADNQFISNFVQQNINSTQLVNVNYHVGFLGQDPFNLADPSDPSSRVLYYGVSAVPYAFLDGVHYTGNPTTANPSHPNLDLFLNWGQGAYDLQTLKLAKADFIGATPATPITVVTQSNVDNSFTADINVIPLLDLPATTTLQVLLLEDTVDISKIDATKVTTGESRFEYVPRQMIPDAVGTKYPATTFKQNTQVHLGPGGSTTLTDKFKWTTAKPFDKNKFTIVVFLQDEVTKEIYQADLFRNITPPTSVVTAIEPTAENIHVYPNPADDELTIELPSAAKEKVSLRMANQLGQFTEFGSFAEGEQKKTINTGNLSEGVYILQIGSSNSAVRTKVIVLHK